MNDHTEALCTVCATRAPRGMTAECNWCGGVYHLNQRNDVEGKDCGAVWIDEQFLALQFACQRCLDGDAASSAPATERPPAPAREASRPRRYRRRA